MALCLCLLNKAGPVWLCLYSPLLDNKAGPVWLCVYVYLAGPVWLCVYVYLTKPDPCGFVYF